MTWREYEADRQYEAEERLAIQLADAAAPDPTRVTVPRDNYGWRSLPAGLSTLPTPERMRE